MDSAPEDPHNEAEEGSRRDQPRPDEGARRWRRRVDSASTVPPETHEQAVRRAAEQTAAAHRAAKLHRAAELAAAEQAA
ncbi:MAG: hypothetical protein JWO76_910, partial [Nocardioides sp.]|nr:hypothetical protein [Nocardioides sp.]